MSSCWVFLLLAAGAWHSAWAEEGLPNSCKTPPRFVPFKPGAVTPEGWLEHWARALAKDMTGHLDERAPVFKHAYRGYHFECRGVQPNGMGWPVEQCAYWLDGLVRLAYILDDEVLIAKAQSRLDPIVDGVLNGGESFFYWQPESVLDNDFNNWGHSHMGRALVAYYQATGQRRILDALVKIYADFPIGEMKELKEVSGACNIDPMLETYVLSGDKRILENVLRFARSDGFQQFVKRWAGGEVPHGHGVIYYEDVRLPALLYPWTRDSEMLAASTKALALGIEHNGLPIGLVSSEEHLAGIGPSRHVETCNVACGAYTFACMLRLTGERLFADRIEKIFFNAAPVTISRDFRMLPYFQVPNRMAAFPVETPLAGGNRSYDLTAGRTMCCVGNVNRVVPNYILNMWMSTPDGGVAATLYGPNTLKTETTGGVPIVIESDTAYPFEEEIRMFVRPEENVEFPLHLRIPSWCQEPQLHLNGEQLPAKPDDSGFVRIDRMWEKNDRITLRLPMRVSVSQGRETPFPEDNYFRGRSLAKVRDVANPFATVSYGPLLFALPIADIDDSAADPNARWNYALDVDPANVDHEIKVVRSAEPDEWPWGLDAPVKLDVPVQEFDWSPMKEQPLPKEPIADGRKTRVALVPYGCTRFRICMFPVTETTWAGRADAKPEIATGVSSHCVLFDASMREGVSCFRIPSLVTAPNGDLVVAVDERVPRCSDLHRNRNINVVVRCSGDGGLTWSELETVADLPDGHPASDPSMIVDEETGEVLLFFNSMDLDKQPGVYSLHVMTSSDNGKSWSEPQEITSQIARSQWRDDLKFITSGRGIQSRSGELFHTLVNLEHGLHLFCSNDHGQSWRLLDAPITPGNESKVVELNDGSLMINSRVNEKGMRWVHTSKDRGLSWQSSPAPSLIDPGCNGSIVRYTSTRDGFDKDRLLFSNASTPKRRENLNVRVSYDEGQSWTEGKTIYPGKAAYSSLTILENGDIGLLFEKDDYTAITFVRFTLEWLTDGKDRYEPPK
ncbi:MAG: glycoside hydrolase family 127 protein [Phycisphaerae bacterium]|nr:glycoside hydrolase family 127 protein [Phycisphaerae bacterium]